ncbi:hypothetical protein MSG28_005576 [Choristoneura fumiferana]|uniref:Uncharacterized protein n=1 Tax=Choristoneura fumiferana TaxID=7141 RepID=A0ACC0KZZ6_CHOFU|nr:hypothetical protein MSG28_005576 [Choristoneura fumiferana]
MVFCYKTITESPRRSPRKLRRTAWSTLSELIALDYENNSDLASIPEREWRLLAALARKREEEDERQKLAEQFHRMWEKEKAGREMMEAHTSHQYQRFVRCKREAERAWLDHKRTLLNLDQQLKKGRLQDAIRCKEKKTEELLASKEDRKATELVDKVIEEEARALLAAERRTRQQTAAQFRKRLEAEDTKRRADEALRKREGILRDSSKRVEHVGGISAARATRGVDAMRRAQYAALAAMAEREARGWRAIATCGDIARGSSPPNASCGATPSERDVTRLELIYHTISSTLNIWETFVLQKTAWCAKITRGVRCVTTRAVRALAAMRRRARGWRASQRAATTRGSSPPNASCGATPSERDVTRLELIYHTISSTLNIWETFVLQKTAWCAKITRGVRCDATRAVRGTRRHGGGERRAAARRQMRSVARRRQSGMLLGSS